MELLEHLLKIDYYARTFGNPMTLPAQDKQKLLEKRASIGLGPKPVNMPTADAPQPASNDVIKDLIAQELKKVLQQK